MQLTTHAVALTATKAPTVQAGHAQEPLLVRLSKGEVQHKCAQHFQAMLPRWSRFGGHCLIQPLRANWKKQTCFVLGYESNFFGVLSVPALYHVLRLPFE